VDDKGCGGGVNGGGASLIYVGESFEVQDGHLPSGVRCGAERVEF